LFWEKTPVYYHPAVGGNRKLFAKTANRYINPAKGYISKNRRETGFFFACIKTKTAMKPACFKNTKSDE
jgi:hypothetical protein